MQLDRQSQPSHSAGAGRRRRIITAAHDPLDADRFGKPAQPYSG
jgi:hypothetical protein